MNRVKTSLNIFNLHFHFLVHWYISRKQTCFGEENNEKFSKLQQHSSAADIIADEHIDQSRVSYSKQLSPIPAIPEPQMRP